MHESYPVIPLPVTEALKPAAWSYDRRQRAWGWLFLSPWLIGVLVFTLIPVIVSLALTFADYNLGRPNVIQFVGLANWQKLVRDPDNFQAVSITLSFAAMWLPVSVILPLAMALFLRSKYLVGRWFWMPLFYLPSVVSATAAAFGWLAFLGGDSGFLNRILRLIGIVHTPYYMEDPNWLLFAFLLVGMWSVGNAMLINMIGLQSVSPDLYDAARVDGANWFTRFTQITLPLISPYIFFNLVFSIIELMHYFALPYIMTGDQISSNPGDPNKAALFVNLYFYKTGFNYSDMGYGATLAWEIFVFGLIAIGVLFITARFWVYYSSDE